MTNTLTPAEAFPPGEYLRDELEVRGWSEKEFAEILGRPVQAVSEIMNGRKQIVPETALAIAEALGTSAELWINLQAAFNLYEAKSGRPPITDVTRRARLRSCLPISELRQRGWLPDTDDLDRLETAVLDFLDIPDFESEPQFAVAARRSNAAESLMPQQRAWLARVRRLALDREVGDFDPIAAQALAADLVHRIHDPTDLGQLETWLGEVGVIVITLLPLKSSKLDGAVILLEDGHPVIGLTSRGDRMDGYVFTLLHELAHICLGHLESTGFRTDEDVMEGEVHDSVELAANRQAAEWIFPESTPLPAGKPTMASILQIASRHRIHASFVIGRIQRARKDWGMLRRSIPRVRPYIAVES
ncbi:MAG TPA: HigA family addiction module antitoxin [Acidimicrobiales bacterium]